MRGDDLPLHPTEPLNQGVARVFAAAAGFCGAGSQARTTPERTPTNAESAAAATEKRHDLRSRFIADAP